MTELLNKILPLHPSKQREILSKKGVDLAGLLDLTQAKLNTAKNLSIHPFVKDTFNWPEEFRKLKNLQDLIIDLTKVKKENTPSYTDYAMALHLKDITISRKGIGVNDGINYAEKFGLPSGITLYNRWNKIQDVAKPEKFKAKAEQIIKKYKI
jgi:hypothetical protein